MADIYSLLDEIYRSNYLYNIAHDSSLQFGFGNRQLLGATILPAKNVPQNAYSEDRIIYQSVIANDATRYSEPRLVGGELVGSFDVRLDEIDIARQMTGKDFDDLNRVFMANPDAARNQVIDWITKTVRMSLEDKMELQRWQAICNGQVTIAGLDGRNAIVPLSQPAGHRVTIPSGTTGNPTGWYSPNYDPLPDLMLGKTKLNQLGYEVNRLIWDVDIVTCLARNALMQSRLGTIGFVQSGSSLQQRPGLVDQNSLKIYLQANFGLPYAEEYNLTYRTQQGVGHFKPRGYIVMLATTGRDETIDVGDQLLTIENTLGYTAVGTSVGEMNPGLVIRGETRMLKPVGMYTQGFGTTFPVIAEPEAIYIIQIPKLIQS